MDNQDHGEQPVEDADPLFEDPEIPDEDQSEFDPEQRSFNYPEQHKIDFGSTRRKSDKGLWTDRDIKVIEKNNSWRIELGGNKIFL